MRMLLGLSVMICFLAEHAAAMSAPSWISKMHSTAAAHVMVQRYTHNAYTPAAHVQLAHGNRQQLSPGSNIPLREWMQMAAGPPRQDTQLQATLFRSHLINLDRSTDRWASFQAAYAASDLARTPLVRVPAADGKALSQSTLQQLLTPSALQELRQIEAVGYREAHFEVTKGGVGCYLSHIRALEHAAAQSEPYALIFEDDATVPSDALALLQRALACAGNPASWDMLVLGCVCTSCAGRPQCSGLKAVQHFFLIHTYIVTPRSAAKILALLRAHNISQQLDHQLSCMAAAGEVTILCADTSGPGGKFRQMSESFATTIQAPLHASKEHTSIAPRCDT